MDMYEILSKITHFHRITKQKLRFPIKFTLKKLRFPIKIGVKTTGE